MTTSHCQYQRYQIVVVTNSCQFNMLNFYCSLCQKFIHILYLILITLYSKYYYQHFIILQMLSRNLIV